jgi:hypothetical protein
LFCKVAHQKEQGETRSKIDGAGFHFFAEIRPQMYTAAPGKPR